MLEPIVVAGIVGLALAYATWKLMPAAWRGRLAQRLGELLVRRGGTLQDARRLERRLTRGACGACDDCGKCAPP